MRFISRAPFHNSPLLTDQALSPLYKQPTPSWKRHPLSTMQVDCLAEACERTAERAANMNDGNITEYYYMVHPDRYIGTGSFNENNGNGPKHFVFEFSAPPHHPEMNCMVAYLAVLSGWDKDNDNHRNSFVTKVKQVLPANVAAQALTSGGAFSILNIAINYFDCQCREPDTDSATEESSSDSSEDSSDDE